MRTISLRSSLGQSSVKCPLRTSRCLRTTLIILRTLVFINLPVTQASNSEKGQSPIPWVSDLQQGSWTLIEIYRGSRNMSTSMTAPRHWSTSPHPNTRRRSRMSSLTTACTKLRESPSTHLCKISIRSATRSHLRKSTSLIHLSNSSLGSRGRQSSQTSKTECRSGRSRRRISDSSERGNGSYLTTGSTESSALKTLILQRVTSSSWRARPIRRCMPRRIDLPVSEGTISSSTWLLLTK